LVNFGCLFKELLTLILVVVKLATELVIFDRGGLKADRLGVVPVEFSFFFVSSFSCKEFY
jgi:hypothetical protein